MLKNLFRGAAAPSGPDGAERIYAIGDIHGCADLLDRLLAKIAVESANAPYRLVFLGDYVDRGPDSRGVLERLVALGGRKPDTIFIKGNHEAVLLDFLDDPAGNANWLDWGGTEMLTSYGVLHADALAPAVLAAALRASMPPTHLAFLKALRLSAGIGDYFFVHAGIKPGVALGDQAEQDLLWIRGEFHNAPPQLRPDKVVVHGHHPIKKPLDAGWRIAVDTGACFTGRLTAVEIAGDRRRFIST